MTLSNFEKSSGAVDCLLCRSDGTRQIDAIEARSLLDAWRQTYGIDIAGEIVGCEKVVLRNCNSCGFQYFQPLVAGSPALYAALCKMDWYYCPDKWEHDLALDDLGGAKRILEIGCGSGDFMARARDEKGVVVEGVEQNPDAIVAARGRGLLVSPGNVEEIARARRGQFDVVCSFQVLEHVPDPRSFLDSCLALLSPRGKLLLGLPNSESFLRHQFNPLDMPPHHMSRWSARVIEGLPRMFPITLEKLRFEPLARNHAYWYLDAHFSRVRPSKLASLLRSPVFLRSLSSGLVRTGLRQLLLGQTLYASFTRT
jgi:SAM-dependent methyltransferase